MDGCEFVHRLSLSHASCVLLKFLAAQIFSFFHPATYVLSPSPLSFSLISAQLKVDAPAVSDDLLKDFEQAKAEVDIEQTIVPPKKG